jgi:iron(III) transport system substrate-binding protein
VYVSSDQPGTAEAILRRFTERTGLRVTSVIDKKTVAGPEIAQWLAGSGARPPADVFWTDEPVSIPRLKPLDELTPYKSPARDGIPVQFTDPDGYWTGFSASLRVIAFNPALVTKADAPRSIFDLRHPQWRGRVAMADPRFGTTSFYVAALYSNFGADRMDELFRQLKANDLRIVPDNQAVCSLISSGAVSVGVLDTDDAMTCRRTSPQLTVIYPRWDEGHVLVVPNMVALLAKAQHRNSGKKLIDFLLSSESEELLAQSEAAQIPLHIYMRSAPHLPNLSSVEPLNIDYAEAAKRVEDVTTRLTAILALPSTQQQTASK